METLVERKAELARLRIAAESVVPLWELRGNGVSPSGPRSVTERPRRARRARITAAEFESSKPPTNTASRANSSSAGPTGWPVP